jgi:signal transduction histidine kinase
MAAIVERLLTLARAEAAVDEAKREPVRLDVLVVRTAADLSSLAKLRHLKLDVKTSPVTVSGDPDRLVDAVTNLVGNAIHYNVENGAITIRVDAHGSLARLTVADTGIDIAADDLPRIFEPFFRADPARSRDAGGAGLGLAVTKAIVERHGGRLTCISQPGRGTTMTVDLPGA